MFDHIERRRINEPISIMSEPTDMHFFKPYLSINQTERKFIGKYITKSEYLAELKTDFERLGSMFSITLLLVLKDP